MALPKLKKQSIIKALEYIDQNGVPSQNQSTNYVLITEDGKKYPPKYVIAVAMHIESGTEISTEGFDTNEAQKYLKSLGFEIDTNQEKYELTITADRVVSTDERFTMDNLNLGDNYKALNSYFVTSSGEKIFRNYDKGETRISNSVFPRLVCQVFEKQLARLSVEERESFPICQATPKAEVIRGIFTSVEEYQKKRNTTFCLRYKYGEGRMFTFYSWNVFSTIIFAQECLKRFGNPGDHFVLIYREKEDKDTEVNGGDGGVPENSEQEFKGYLNPYSSMLIESKNIIFRGAPGTGKSYLAKEIAADIVSNGFYDKYTSLKEEQKKQVEFVQFHPSYDYSDFVEGLRPIINNDGTMGFELQDGIFKKFVNQARKNYENAHKPLEAIKNELSVQESIKDFFSNIEFGVDKFKTITGNEFTITSISDEYIYISIPGNASVNKLCLNINDIRKMLESGEKFTKIKDLTAFFGKTYATQAYSYDFALYKAIKQKKTVASKTPAKPEKLRNYVFIIDEINRGEISKIFGELFFAIDPGYRGKAGEVSTQYSNLHSDPNEKFYIPENVFIIGTMNDIDRSVDSFDFAMRRRFRFVELKANERMDMLEVLDSCGKKDEAIQRMEALNKAIVQVEDLNENYQIGAAYFLKLKTLSFDQLWTDYLQPLLQEYIQGTQNEEEYMRKFAKAYGYEKPIEGGTNEAAGD